MKKIFWIASLLTIAVTSCTTTTPNPELEFTLEPTLIVDDMPAIPPTVPAYLPQSGDSDLDRANAIPSSIYLLYSESDPAEVLLHLGGYLPTPCHQLRISVPPPDDANNIYIEVYSVAEKSLNCEQVLRAFDTQLNLGTYPAGSYWVWVNGSRVGNFDF